MMQGPPISHAAVLAASEATLPEDNFENVDEENADFTYSADTTEKKLCGNHGQGIDLAVASQTTIDSLTFNGTCRLRGARLGRLLRCFGNVMSLSGSETFELSQPAESLDVFISHNWSVSRFQKTLALCLHFNFKLAVLYMIAVVAVAVALKWTEHEVRVEVCRPWMGFSQEYALTCKLLYIGVFPVIFWGRDLLAVLGLDRTQVFFDKLCIDQRSEAAKARGIKRLGAFIYRSQSMVAVCSNEYYTRLWTIYEIATFLALHPRHKLVLLPSAMTNCTYVLTLGFYAFIVLATFDSALNCQLWFGVIQIRVAPIFFILITLVMVSHLRDWLIEFWKLEVKLQDFSLEKAACCDEADRTSVKANVVALARDLGLLQAQVSDSSAVLAFEGLVRKEVPKATLHCTGRWGFPYRHLVFIGAPLLMVGVDHVNAADDLEWCFLVMTCFMTFVMIPLSYVLLVIVVKCLVRCRGARKQDRLAVIISTLLYLGLLGAVSNVNWVLFERAVMEDYEHQVEAAILLGLLYATAIGLAWLAFRKPSVKARNEPPFKKLSTGAFESAFRDWMFGVSSMAPSPAIAIGCGKDSFPCPISNV